MPHEIRHCLGLLRDLHCHLLCEWKIRLFMRLGDLKFGFTDRLSPKDPIVACTKMICLLLFGEQSVVSHSILCPLLRPLRSNPNTSVEKRI